jgi:membrane-bound lytic murein transglycosylase D
MVKTMRLLMIGGILPLVTICALVGVVHAEPDFEPLAMAGSTFPMTAEPKAVPAVWSAPSDSTWTDVFGPPSLAPLVRTASFTPAPESMAVPARVLPEPAPAYRVHVNQHVRFFLERFQTGDRRAVIESYLARSGRYLPMILDVFQRKGLPEELGFTAMIESGFNPVAVSRVGARGLWQFMAPTARLYGLRVDRWLDERLDPEKSTVAAANYLRDLYATFGSWDLAQAAYNAGEVRVQRAIERTGTRDFWKLHRSPLLFEETKNFVPAIQAAILISRQPQRYGFTVVPEEPLRYEQVTVPKASRLSRLAALSGVPLEDLESLNPELRQKQAPPDTSYELKVPLGAAGAVRAALEELAKPPRVASDPRSGVHVVKAGDTLWHIARRYGVTATQLAHWNGLEHPDRILPGDHLRVAAPATS